MMGRTFFNSLLLAAILIYLVGVMVRPGTAYGEMVQLVTGNEYPPFTDENLPHGGLATRLIRLIYQDMGMQPVFAFRPWKRGYAETLEGKFEGTFPYIYTEERAEVFEYSEPFFYVIGQIYIHRQSGLTIETDKDLVGLKTCLPTGYANSASIENLVVSGVLKRETASSMAACFRKLAHQRIHFVEANNFLGPISMRKSGEPLDLFSQAKMVTDRIGQFVIFPKSNPNASRLIEGFNSQLKKFQANRRLDQIVEQYLTENSGKL